MGGRGSIWMMRVAVTMMLLVGAAFALDRLFPPELSRLATTGTEIRDQRGRIVALLPAPGGVWRFRTDANQVAPVLRDLLIAVEDRRFWWHPGVDPLALARAVWQWVRVGRVVSGGSTLSMQTARLLQPRPRTFRSKVIEIARAVQLELHLGKQGVLDIWMTLAPYGGNLEGVRAGSLAWFGVQPEALEPSQAALLVAIPRRPESLRPDRHAEDAALLRDRVLAVGHATGLFSATDMPPVPTVRTRFPRLAPQPLAALARASRDRTITTTLDRPLQIALERLALERLRTLDERVSLAVVVADARSREIRAIHAGAWADPLRSGALDLTRAVRSPGSALKPLIYGLAFQEGLISPESLVGDLPNQFGGYAPENFDRGFAGTVTAAEALRRSLNVPAVALLDRIGPVRFVSALKAAGIRLALPDGVDPSLPLALGGLGIDLRQVTALYAALATDGRFLPLRLVGEPGVDQRLLSHSAVRSVADVLTHPMPNSTTSGIAWKTGTSWGGRDAWAVGFDAHHVVGVWIGRPDGTPIPGATGLSVALPLLARVFDLLPANPRPSLHSRSDWPNVPPLGVAPGSAETPDAPRLLFPPPGAVLSSDGPVTLRVMGGRRPLTFLVDGRPLPTEPIRREVSWHPAGPGFYRLTVLDADGSTTQVRVRVR